MKIKYFKGDLLESNLLNIAHGCNRQGGFGSGIAKSIANKYPKAKQDYLANNSFRKAGGTVITSVQPNGVVIYNCLTQDYYGPGDKQYVNYDYIRKVFHTFQVLYDNGETFPSLRREPIIGIPKIGAGLAGGDWNVISSIIGDEIKTLEVHCYIL